VFINYKIKGITQLGIYEQCGGKGYNGSTTCVSGLTCYVQYSGYSACDIRCPQYWQCQRNGKIKKKNLHVTTVITYILPVYSIL
jgi:hypothetical protein